MVLGVTDIVGLALNNQGLLLYQGSLFRSGLLGCVGSHHFFELIVLYGSLANRGFHGMLGSLSSAVLINQTGFIRKSERLVCTGYCSNVAHSHASDDFFPMVRS